MTRVPVDARRAAVLLAVGLPVTAALLVADPLKVFGSFPDLPAPSLAAWVWFLPLPVVLLAAVDLAYAPLAKTEVLSRDRTRLLLVWQRQFLVFPAGLMLVASALAGVDELAAAVGVSLGIAGATTGVLELQRRTRRPGTAADLEWSDEQLEQLSVRYGRAALVAGVILALGACAAIIDGEGLSVFVLQFMILFGFLAAYVEVFGWLAFVRRDCVAVAYPAALVLMLALAGMQESLAALGVMVAFACVAIAVLESKRRAGRAQRLEALSAEGLGDRAASRYGIA